MTAPVEEIIDQTERLGKPAGGQEAESFVLPQVEVTLQGRLLEARVTVGVRRDRRDGERRGGVRGRIVGPDLTRGSRRRLQKLLARLEGREKWLRVWTFTFDGMPSSVQVAKAQMRCWLKRALRRYPNLCGVVRIEPQRRGAPHFHVMTWGAYIPHEQGWSWWREVTGAGPGRGFVFVAACQSWKAAAKYVSKYVSKSVQAEWELARAAAAAAAEGDPASAGTAAAAAASLDLLTYWAAPGRLWGVFNSAKLPFGERTVVKMGLGSFYSMRRAARHLWQGVGARRYCGFSLFTDDIGSWGALAVRVGA